MYKPFRNNVAGTREATKNAPPAFGSLANRVGRLIFIRTLLEAKKRTDYTAAVGVEEIARTANR
jgi:hypothetical protein